MPESVNLTTILYHLAETVSILPTPTRVPKTNQYVSDEYATVSHEISETLCFFCFVVFLTFGLFRATPAAYGGSQARVESEL